MRQALADLGLGARNADLANYLRDKFGIEAKNIAVLKSTAKKSLFNRDEEQPDLPRPDFNESQAEEDPTAALEDVTLVVVIRKRLSLDAPMSKGDADRAGQRQDGEERHPLLDGGRGEGQGPV